MIDAGEVTVPYSHSRDVGRTATGDYHKRQPWMATVDHKAMPSPQQSKHVCVLRSPRHRAKQESGRWRDSWRASLLPFAIVAALVTAMSGEGRAQAPAASSIPRMPGGKPNFTGLWQTLGTANWDIRDH